MEARNDSHKDDTPDNQEDSHSKSELKSSSNQSVLDRNVEPDVFESGIDVGVVLADRYEIQEKIDDGGFAEVFLAFDRKSKQNVALKVPKFDAPVIDANDVSQRESDALSRLNHNRIVKRLNTFVYQNRIVVVTQWIDGISFKEVLVESPFEVDAATQLAIEICEGLSHAHSNGVIHRDIKPSNLMIDRRGHATILDFGLSRLVNINDKLPTGNSSVNGQLKGSLSYMSPEQARGQIDQIDHRTDIFSLGIVLYELLTGINPITERSGRSSGETIARPSKLNQAVSAGLDSVVLKALKHHKTDRFASAKAMMLALEATQRPSFRRAAVSVPVEKRGRWSTGNLVGVGLLTLLMCFLGFAIFNSLGGGNGELVDNIPPSANTDPTNAAELRPVPDEDSLDGILVHISTSPPGGEIVAVPISEGGEPDFELAVKGVSADFERRLSPGRYLFCAHLGDDMFHEVFRHVRFPGQKNAGGFPEQRFEIVENLENAIKLTRIKLHKNDDSGMVTIGPILVDENLVKYDDGGNLAGTFFAKSNDGTLVNTSYTPASRYLESIGKRLPFLSELALLEKGFPSTINPELCEWTASIKQIELVKFDSVMSDTVSLRSFQIFLPSGSKLFERINLETKLYEDIAFRGVRRKTPRFSN